MNSLDYVFRAVEETKNLIPANLPLIGFCGSPWTLAAYSIEGGGSKDFQKTKTFMAENPNALHDFLEILSDACYQYLKQQVLSGVNAIQIFDSWADLLSEDELDLFSLSYTKKITQKLKNDPITKHIPIILFEKNPNKDITDLIFKDLSCISLYWNSDIRILSESLKNDIAIQGNLDPKVLGKSDETIQEEVRKICSIMKEYPGFIFNLGHGITPDIEPAKVEVMIKTIREDI